MRSINLAAFVVLSFLATPIAAQVVDTDIRHGEWQIFSRSNAMTDELSCVAYFGDRKDVQLTINSIAISYRGRGGVRGYEYRIGDEAPSGMQLPSDTERRVGVVVLDGELLDRILASDRLRVQVTNLSSIQNDDIDLTAAASAVAGMSEMGCR